MRYSTSITSGIAAAVTTLFLCVQTPSNNVTHIAPVAHVVPSPSPQASPTPTR